MAKRFLDIIEFTYNTSEAYKTKVVELLWTIHYWPLGRQLLEELTRTATDKLFTPKLLIENFAGGHDYKEFHGGGSLPSELGHLYFDLDYCRKKPYEIDPTQEYVVQCNKTYVYLFHELVHYHHDLLGQFRRGAPSTKKSVRLVSTSTRTRCSRRTPSENRYSLTVGPVTSGFRA